MEQVVAFVDEQRCSLAAVRRAVSLVPHGGMLFVVMLGPRVPLQTAASWTQGLSVPDLREEMVRETFREAALLVAPSGLPWDFSVRVRPFAGAVLPALPVTVRHRGGLLHSLSGAHRVERFARASRLSAAPTVVPCDHRAEIPAAHRAPKSAVPDAT